MEVARDAKFRKVISNHTKTVRASKDHCLETRVAGKALKPGHEYFYRFETRTGSSPVGRFRTLPAAGSRQPVKIVFFSCQDWQAGYYGAHRAIAAEDADLVVGLGDYIYERNFYDGPRKDTLGANHDGEVETLDEYRQKYRMYKADANLRAMHAAHSYVGIFDDHEVEDNWAGGQPRARRRCRCACPSSSAGPTASAPSTSTCPSSRCTASPPWAAACTGACVWAPTPSCSFSTRASSATTSPAATSSSCPAPAPRATRGASSASARRAWLKQYLKASGATWKLVGNQVMIMALDTISGAPINKDSWDGYGAERRDLLGYVRDQAHQGRQLPDRRHPHLLRR